jgi:hypothetical protein
MARGLPDYQRPSMSISQKVIDLSALLVAISGVPLIDGRGRLYYLDNFRNGIAGYTTVVVGDGVAGALATTLSEVEPNSVNINGGTTGGGGSSEFGRGWIIDVSGRIGLELGVRIAITNQTFQVKINFSTAAALLTARVTMNPTTRVISVFTPTGEVTFSASEATFIANTWTTIKLVADFDLGYYVRFILNGVEYDLTAYQVRTAAGPTAGLLWTSAIVTPTINFAAQTRIGHWALTVDEP